MADKEPDLIDVEELAPAEVAELDLYQKREKIYTRKIEGFYQRLRLYTGWPLLIAYFALPWISVNGRQAVWFDLPERKFHIFTLTFWPQDFPLLAFLLIIAAFGLFAVTVVAGRVWCGYTCPQTVWTSIFMWIEQKTEGSRNQRIRLDKTPWTVGKALRKASKHGGWLFVAFATGMTFVGYFYPVRDLVVELATLSTGKWQALWTLFFTVATYINAGWMREQVCTYMCPYARFQSVMFDRDTLIVSYDPARGEPRGSRKRSADPAALGLGDCINCDLCVQVCPTGIDIRQGLQYECIGCALCIDACNSVMDKMGYEPGLIRYTSENALEGNRTHWARPRVIGYLTVLALMVGVFSYSVLTRLPLEMTIIRDRNNLYVETQGGDIENMYRIQLVNMDTDAHEFDLTVNGIPQAQIIGDASYSLDAGEVRSITLRVRAQPQFLDAPGTEISFEAIASDMPALRIAAESRFLRPM
ncbi:MAG: cytochrome c oxidase accessory protein CcoG [Chromatocurvus sp.]